MKVFTESEYKSKYKKDKGNCGIYEDFIIIPDGLNEYEIVYFIQAEIDNYNTIMNM